MSPETPPDPVSAEHYTEQYYLESCGGAEFFRLYGPKVVKPLQAYALKRAELAPGMKALEVGCGRGELLYQLGEKGVLGVGVDYAAPALRLAARTAKALVALCDAKRLPFRDRSFERIFFLGVMDHLHDWELEACFREFRRTLKPGGFVLANTCTNKQYYKNLSYGLRKALARLLGLKEPSPPRSSEDRVLHVNEHDEKNLSEFFRRIGWKAEIEPRPNDKYFLHELYGRPLPEKFPLKPAPAWKSLYLRLAFRGPLKRYLARELFCRLSPPAD